VQEGFLLDYEVLPGNTIDNQTLRAFLGRIERQYGKARRIWLMDRGIPTEEVLDETKRSDRPTAYLVGTPKGVLKLEANLATRPWQQAREGMEVVSPVPSSPTHGGTGSRSCSGTTRAGGSAPNDSKLGHWLGRRRQVHRSSSRVRS
jgi:hypothetical protein